MNKKKPFERIMPYSEAEKFLNIEKNKLRNIISRSEFAKFRCNAYKKIIRNGRETTKRCSGIFINQLFIFVLEKFLGRNFYELY